MQALVATDGKAVYTVMTDISIPVNLVEELWTSSIYGIPEGHTLDVRTGWCAVIVQDGSILYVLNPYAYLLTRENFPLLQPLPFQQGSQPMLWGTIYLIRTEDVVLFWEQPITRKARWSEGASFENVRGHYGVRGTNPPQFLTAIYRRLYASGAESGGTRSFQLSRPNTDAGQFATRHLATEANRCAYPMLERALSVMEIKSRHTPGSILQNPEAAQSEIGNIIAPYLSADGVDLQFLTIDGVSPRASIPCEACGSDARPTSQVSFSSNISLFVVRFMRSRRGCFCAFCACKYFLEHTAITLVAGWWGVIGCLLSPILIGSNIVNLSKALFRFRMPHSPPILEPESPRLR